MADDNDKFEEEYSGEEEYISEYEEPTGETEIEPEIEAAPTGASADPSQGGVSAQMKKMMTWGAIGVGTVLVALYLNYSEKAKRAEVLDEGTVDQNIQLAPVADLAKQETKATEPQVPVATEVPVATFSDEPETKVAQAPVPSDNAVSATKMESPAVALPADVAASISQEKERVTALAQRVKDNQSMISSVLVRMNSLEQSLGEMNKTLESINSNVKKAAQKPVVKKPTVTRKPVAKKPSIQRVYGLKAVVPGRAWIESASGDSRSITVGDRIPGHGKVKVISPIEGYVLTTSGTMIVYGPGDF